MGTVYGSVAGDKYLPGAGAARPRLAGPLIGEIIGGRVARGGTIDRIKNAAAPGREQQMVMVGEIILTAQIEAAGRASSYHVRGLMK